jgi:hypothetical protein
MGERERERPTDRLFEKGDQNRGRLLWDPQLYLQRILDRVR